MAPAGLKVIRGASTGARACLARGLIPRLATAFFGRKATREAGAMSGVARTRRPWALYIRIATSPPAIVAEALLHPAIKGNSHDLCENSFDSAAGPCPVRLPTGDTPRHGSGRSRTGRGHRCTRNHGLDGLDGFPRFHRCDRVYRRYR